MKSETFHISLSSSLTHRCNTDTGKKKRNTECRTCEGVRTRGEKSPIHREMMSVFCRSGGLFKKRQSPMSAGLGGGGGGGGVNEQRLKT